MKKPAFVLSCSKNYLYGLNAVLNGLQYYGNTADVHVLWLSQSVREFEDISVEFFEKMKTANFGFKVVFIDIIEFAKNYDYKPNNVWVLKFLRWKYVTTIKDQYNTVCALGADILILDDLMPYFELVESNSIIMTGRNALGSYSFSHPAETPVHTNNAPIADVPAFFNIENGIDFCETLYDIGWNHIMGDMPAFYFSIMQLKKKVVLLPDNLWIRNFTHYRDPISKGEVDGRIVMVSEQTRHRISMVHGKWWDVSRCNKEINASKGGPNEPIARRNFKHYYDLYEFFNTKCEVQLPWNRGVVQ